MSLFCIAADAKRQEGSSELETVIGYTDSRPFAAAVGPVAAALGEAKGRFADLVSVQMRPSPTNAQPPAETTAAAAAAGSPQSSSASAAATKQLAQEEFRKYMESRKRSSLYDDLPPAAADD